MRTVWRPAACMLVALAIFASSAGAATSSYSRDQLDQMVAPIALYPDSLLMQILMASAYPVEIVDADRWAKSNPNISDSERQQQLSSKNWDPSVTSLTAFPDVLSRMSQNLDWTEAMGEAFISQQKDVLAAVQDMRAKAQAAGTLQSTSQQTVVASGEDISIASPSTDMVYVPLYDPTTVYGTWGVSAWMWPGVMVAPYGYVPGRPLAFASGVAVGAAMFGGVDWGTRNVYVNRSYWNYPAYRSGAANSVYARNGTVNVTRNNSVNVNRTSWQYDNTHRQSANFQNTTLQNRYGSTARSTTATSQELRGYSKPTSTSMPGSRSIPYTPTASSGNRTSLPRSETGFGQYNSANAANRASSRGAASTGRAGAGFDRVPRSAPSRSVNFGGRGGGRRR